MIESKPEKVKKEYTLKDYLVMFFMGISALYLLNPTMGVIELIPDNIPIIGNLDEGVAVTILLSGLKYFGVNLTNIFKNRKLNG